LEMMSVTDMSLHRHRKIFLYTASFKSKVKGNTVLP